MASDDVTDDERVLMFVAELKQERDALASELAAARERIAVLEAAFHDYVDYHQACEPHHPDDCEHPETCYGRRIDAAVNAALGGKK